MLGGDLGGLGQAGTGEDVQAGHLFLGLGERSVGDQRLPVAHADRPGPGGRLQPAPRQLHAPRLCLFVPRPPAPGGPPPPHPPPPPPPPPHPPPPPPHPPPPPRAS